MWHSVIALTMLTHNGNLLDSLLGLLEARSAKRWHDPYVEAAVDLSHVVWIGTANTLNGVSGPLRDRCRIVQFPEPGPEHLEILAPKLLAKTCAWWRLLDNIAELAECSAQNGRKCNFWERATPEFVKSCMRHMTREYCLSKADECQREAERAKDQGTRRVFEFYVRHWIKLADTFLDRSAYHQSHGRETYRSH
jgi:hypothetical protein